MESDGRETEIKQRRIGNKWEGGQKEWEGGQKEWEGGQKEWEVREENTDIRERIRGKGKHKTNKDESSIGAI